MAFRGAYPSRDSFLYQNNYIWRSVSMTYETFLEWIPDLVQSQLGEGVKVRLHTIYKNNNIRKDALCVLEEGCNVSPTIYLEKYYDRWKRGISLEQISHEICREYAANHCGMYMDVKAFYDFEIMKDKIVYKLIHYDHNRELLNEVPHRRFLDLAIVYYLLVEDPFIGSGTALIHHKQRQMWQVDEETLYEMATCNTDKLLGNEILPMQQVILELLQRDMRRQLESDMEMGICTEEQVDLWAAEILDQMLPKEHHSMFVLSNHNKYLGAAAVLNQKRLLAFAAKLGCGFHVIPSSIHEMILVPDTESLQREDLQRLLREINEEEENIQEYLSDQLYYCDRENGVRMIADEEKK